MKRAIGCMMLALVGGFQLGARAESAEPASLLPARAIADRTAEVLAAEESADCSSNCLDCALDCGPVWGARAGAVVLTRRTPHAQELIENTNTSATVINANQYDFNWAVGADVTLFRTIDECNDLEIRYFGVDGLSATDSTTTPGIWNFPTNPPLFGLGAANVVSTYESRIHSTEVNWRHHASEAVTLLAGFRWIELHENLGFAADFGGNQASVNSNTDNHLYGLQVGVDARLATFGRFEIEGLGKAGYYANAADNSFGVTQAIGPAFAAGQGVSSNPFVGELALTGVYWWTDCVALRGGYQALWITDAALASNQLQAVDVINATGVDARGDVLYHGATLGVELWW